MADSSFIRFYDKLEFVALATAFPVPEQFATYLATKALANPLLLAQAVANQGITVTWPTWPGPADIAIVDAAVADFTAAPMTSAPISVLSAAATTAPNTTPVSKIDFTSPPLEAGTYSITFTGQLRLVTAAAGDSVRVLLTFTFSGFPAFTQMFEWPFALTAPYNYAVTGQVSAGQTIRVQASVSKNGAGAAVAECSKARFTIDKIG